MQTLTSGFWAGKELSSGHGPKDPKDVALSLGQAQDMRACDIFVMAPNRARMPAGERMRRPALSVRPDRKRATGASCEVAYIIQFCSVTVIPPTTFQVLRRARMQEACQG